MTAYCEKCGNQLRESAKFCHSCGAVAANFEPQSSSYSPGSSASTPPASYSAPPRGSYSPQPPPNYPQGWQASNIEVPKKSSGIGKIIVIALLVMLAFAGVFAVGTFFAIRRAVHIGRDANGNQEVSIQAPGGSVKIGHPTLTEAELGVPIYPGSTPSTEGGSVSISGTGAGKSGFVGVATFKTADSVDEVADFYREKLPKDTSVAESSKSGTRSIVFSTKSDSGGRVITVTDSNNEKDSTLITIVNAKGRGFAP